MTSESGLERPQDLWREGRAWLRSLFDDRFALVLAALLVVATAALVVRGTYAPTNGGLAARVFQAVTAVVPISIAALLVLRPWSGLCLWVLAMPIVNLLRVQVTIRSIQLIPTTVFLVALAVGLGLEYLRRRRAETPAGAAARSTAGAFPRVAVGLLAVCALSVLFALGSGLASPDRTTSLIVSLHGMIEPIVLGMLVLLARPTVRQLGGLSIAMGVSVVLATLINVPRFLYVYGTAFEVQRIYFARLTYYNVGIYGDMLVMAIPLILAALFIGVRAAPPLRSGTAPLRRGSDATWQAVRVVAVVVAITVMSGAIYLTYSKSAWIGGLVVGALLVLGLVRATRFKIAGLAALLLVSALLIPYPLLVQRALGGGAASPTPATTQAPGATAAPIAAGATPDATPAATPAPAATPTPAPTSAAGPTSDRVNSFDIQSVEGEMSITERYLATKAALRMALDHPAFGVGPGRFAVEYGGPYHDPQATDVLDSAHDLVPEIAATFGLPLALLFTLAALAALVAAAVMWQRGSGIVRPLAAILGTALVGFLVVSALFGVDLYRPYRLMNSDVLYAALLLGAIAALWMAHRREVHAQP